MLERMSAGITLGLVGLTTTPLECVGLAGYKPKLYFWMVLPIVCSALILAGVLVYRCVKAVEEEKKKKTAPTAAAAAPATAPAAATPPWLGGGSKKASTVSAERLVAALAATSQNDDRFCTYREDRFW